MDLAVWVARHGGQRLDDLKRLTEKIMPKVDAM